MNVSALTEKGEDHEENEDSFLIDIEKNLFAIADGVSIPKGGSKASKLACELLQKLFKNDLKKAISNLMKRYANLVMQVNADIPRLLQ